MVGGASFISGFDIDKIMQMGWFRFMKEIARNIYYFVLQTLVGLEPVKRFECRSDVWVLRTAGDGACVHFEFIEYV